MLNRNKFLWEILFFLLILFLCLRPVIDPDLGWHIGTGRYILEQRTIPQKDIFSFTQPDYAYAYLYWLSEFFIYIFFLLSGLWGVTFFYALIAAAGFWILANMIKKRGKKLNIHYFLIYFIPISIWVIGLRTQVVTFLGLVLLYYIFDQKELKLTKSYWFIPLMFILWANMHGGFILGLAFLGLMILFKIIEILYSNLKTKKKKFEISKFILLTILAASSVLVNPYGFQMYKQALQIATNRFNAQYNLDWQPLITDESHTFVFALLLFVVVALILLTGKRISWKEKILVLLFFLLSLKTKRFVLPLLVVLLPTFFSYVYSFFSARKKMFNTNQFPLFVALFSVALIFIGESTQKKLTMWTAYQSQEYYATKLSNDLKYPYHAVAYMKENGVPDRLLNEFYWGGYLIWNLPDHKFFIDGRMDTFIVKGESFAKIYWQIINLSPGWQELLDEYTIDSILAPVDDARHWPLTEFLRDQPDWKIVHEDDVSIYLIKIGSS